MESSSETQLNFLVNPVATLEYVIIEAAGRNKCNLFTAFGSYHLPIVVVGRSSSRLLHLPNSMNPPHNIT